MPLLIRAPGRLPAGERRSGPVVLMDLMPTLLDLVELDGPDYLEGRSVLEHLRSGTPLEPLPLLASARATVALTYTGEDQSWLPPSYAVTQWPLRLVRVRTPDDVRYELYDLESDPDETDNVYASRGQESQSLRELVDNHEASCIQTLEELTGRYGSRSPASLAGAGLGGGLGQKMSEEMSEKLRELGYLLD